MATGKPRIYVIRSLNAFGMRSVDSQLKLSDSSPRADLGSTTSGQSDSSSTISEIASRESGCSESSGLNEASAGLETSSSIITEKGKLLRSAGEQYAIANGNLSDDTTSSTAAMAAPDFDDIFESFAQLESSLDGKQREEKRKKRIAFIINRGDRLAEDDEASTSSQIAAQVRDVDGDLYYIKSNKTAVKSDATTKSILPSYDGEEDDNDLASLDDFDAFIKFMYPNAQPEQTMQEENKQLANPSSALIGDANLMDALYPDPKSSQQINQSNKQPQPQPPSMPPTEPTQPYQQTQPTPPRPPPKGQIVIKTQAKPPFPPKPPKPKPKPDSPAPETPQPSQLNLQTRNLCSFTDYAAQKEPILSRDTKSFERKRFEEENRYCMQMLAAIIQVYGVICDLALIFRRLGKNYRSYTTTTRY